MALNINDLTDEEKKALGIPVIPSTPPAATSPFTRPEVDPNANVNDPLYVDTDTAPTVNPDFGWKQLLDLDEPDIKREQQDQVFDGSTYQKSDPSKAVGPLGLPALALPIGMSAVDPEAKATNDALYKQQGHALVPGWEDGPRLQDSVDATGNKETSFVPPASFGPVERVLSGGALEAAKGVAKIPAVAAEALDGRNWANFLTQNLPISAKLKEELKIAKPDTVAWIDSNFPTMPAASPAEKMAQEITSIVIGGLGGGKATEMAIDKLPAVQKLIAQNAQDFLESFGAKNKVDVVNAQQKTEAFIKSMTIEFAGSNTGATITTPDDSQPLTGSTFVDNTIGSGIFRVLGLGYKSARNLWSGTHGGGSAPISETGLAADLFRQVDPDVVNVSQEEFLRRAGAFSKIIADNSEVTNNTFGNLAIGPASALYQGSRQYVDEAYGYLKNSLGPKYEDWANAKAGQIADSIQSFKRDNLSSPIVQQADANIIDRGKTAIAGQAELLGTQEAAKQAASDIAEPLLQKFNAAKSSIRTGEADVADASDRLAKVANGNAFLEAIDKNTAGAAFDNDFAHITDKRAKAVAAQEKWKQSLDNYKGKFNNLPLGKSFNVQELANKLENFGNQDDIGKLFNLQGGAPTQKFGKMAEDADGMPVDKLNVIDNLAGKDMRWLVTEARPYFTQQLEAAKNAAINGKTPVNMKEYTDLIQWIDEQADNYPGFKEAKQAYAEHMQKWGQIEETKRLNTLAKESNNAVEKGADQTYREFYNFQDRVLKDPDGSGVMLKNWMKSFDVQDKEAGEFVMNELVNTLATAKPQDADTLISVIKPQMPKFKAVNPEYYNLINSAIKEVEQAKSGLKGADDGLKIIKDKAKQMYNESADTAAVKFIEDRAIGNAEFAGESALERTNKMFSNTSETKKLFTEATATGNPKVVEGLQGQFLRWMNDNVFTSRVVSASGNGRAVTEASLSKLNDILDGSDRKWKETFDIVFADKPQFREDFDLLLKTMRDDVNVRSNRPQTFSSNTAVDTARNSREQAASLLTTILFGRLNRTAATVGALTKALSTAKTAADEQALMKILPTLLTDSTTLTNVLDEIVKNPKMEDIGHLVDKLVDNSAGLTNTAKGTYFTGVVPEKKEDDTEKALGVK